ncbi:hypothetical protein ACIA8K_17780 [Catenuloplanes sp. NPDC051500]|uniref:hypothetical protein n=1 Tax=Catenuloplanes sp. NPDC051500 TaxID=3363959 RepID=UPI0037BD0683
MASHTWLLSDADRTVVAARPVSVPGGKRTRRGWLVEVTMPAGDRLGRHGGLLTTRVVTVLGLGLLCAVFTVADLLVPARVACLALLAAFAWTGVAYHRTNRLATLVRGGTATSLGAGTATGPSARGASGPRTGTSTVLRTGTATGPGARDASAPRLNARAMLTAMTSALRGRAGEPAAHSPADDVHVLTSDEDRHDLHRGLRLAERIWADRAVLNLDGDTERLLGTAVRDLAGALVQRQRLREIWNGIDRHDDAGLPPDSPAVLAARLQGDRADALWAELDREVQAHLTSLKAAAESGASLIREIELGDAARRTRVALDSLGAPTAATPTTGLSAETFANAYRDLAARYGHDLYS